MTINFWYKNYCISLRHSRILEANSTPVYMARDTWTTRSNLGQLPVLLDGFGWMMLTGGGGTISSNWSGSENTNEDGIHLNLRFPNQASMKVQLSLRSRIPRSSRNRCSRSSKRILGRVTLTYNMDVRWHRTLPSFLNLKCVPEFRRPVCTRWIPGSTSRSWGSSWAFHLVKCVRQC